MAKMLLFVGTYTEPLPHVPTAHAEGINTYSFDPTTGKIDYLSSTHGIDNPTYTTVDRAGKHLYAVCEFEGGRENVCAAFKIDRDTGILSLINEIPTLGDASCFVTVDHSGKYVMVANYAGGKTAIMLPIREDGGLGMVSETVQHEGRSVNEERQTSPHGHCILPDPNNNYVVVADLGIDQLVRYKLDASNGKLIPAFEGSVKLDAGSGPRHFVFHPSGEFVYVLSELLATVTVFSYDAVSGMMHNLQTISMLPEGYDGQKWAAAIRITADGRFVYGSNRGHDSLAMFAVDQQSGQLTSLGFQSTGGKVPRDFNIDPTGQWLLAANQATDTVVTFKINPTTGVLEETGIVAEVATPVCLTFLMT
ncbi:MAG: beta-propeller fold lactonase family protein [Anaerolineaceae bacterium]|nr:beta-propeller fold lactonase family protein [Anaerolineaceae bacterium]